MNRLRDLSIRYKLVGVIVATSSVTLLLATGAFLFYDITTYKDSMAAELAVEADIIAVNCTAALTFNDHEAAGVILSGMEKRRAVTRASLLGPDGDTLATYRRWDQPQNKTIARLQSNGYAFVDDRLTVRRSISFDGEVLGYVYIESDLSQLNTRISRFVAVGATLISFAFALVLAVSGRLQKVISTPILALAETVGSISRQKDFTVRARKFGNDEVGGLIDGFNEMVKQIQDRDVELQKHRGKLEEEVAERTRELRVVNNDLQQSRERLRAIFEGTASKTGKAFLDALVIALARALGTRWVAVGMTRGDQTIRFLSMWDGTSIQRDAEHPLPGTPCAEVVANGSALYREGLREAFPDCTFAHDFNVDSYVGYALTDSNGSVLGVLSAFHDDTLPSAANDQELLRVFASRAAAELERLQVEKELQRSEASTRAILRSAADGIITVDGDSGVVLTANPAAEQIFGLPKDEIVGASVGAFIRPIATDQAELATAQPIRALMGLYVGTRGVAEGIRAHGSSFPIEIAANEMRHEGRIAFTAMVRDITRERELEKLKADFISTISHEIRTPLSCIMSSANILRKYLNTKPEVIEKFSGIIFGETQRLTRLVNDMLDLSKMDSGAVDWHVEPSSPVELARSVSEMFAAYAAERGVALETDFEDGLCEIEVDRDKIRQVLTNLVSNALKFTDEGGRVRIAVKHSDQGVLFSITDDGVGIDADDQQLVFQRFKQIGDVQTDRPKGTGLGLPICKEIVLHFRGDIWIESKRGAGSTFYFNLPYPRAAEGPTVSLEPPPSPDPQALAPAHDTVERENTAVGDGKSRKPVVLVVDDDKSTRSIIAFHLESNGITVLQASGGRDALEVAKQSRPDLITLDVMMPELSGYDVVDALRKDPALRDIPVVLLSVLGGIGNQAHALHIGADAYLDKPVSGPRLLRTVHSLLGDRPKQLLLVVDNPTEAEPIDADLSGHGYQVTQVYDEETCLESALKTQPDLIIVGGSCTTLDSQKLIGMLRDNPDTAEISVVLLTELAMDDALPLEAIANPEVGEALRELVSKIRRPGGAHAPEPVVLIAGTAGDETPTSS